MYLITFRIRSLYRREFSDYSKAAEFFQSILTNRHIHTIMFFDTNGDIIEVV